MALALVSIVVGSGCATIQEMAALRAVDFTLQGTSGGTLAGIPIESTRSYEDLGIGDVARLADALSRRELPLRVTLLVGAANPPDNARARLTELDWTLFLDDRETVSGVVDREYVLPPGEPVTVPVAVELDLLDFFDRNLESVVGLALAVAGAGEPQRVRLEARPTVQTPLGPIRYPEPVRVEYEVGA
ncbi:MAG: hypothetical protein R3223_07220 [Longimicrobiales bacterium]|nr:hypothetical protein [Longimicrobiales bacterium]